MPRTNPHRNRATRAGVIALVFLLAASTAAAYGARRWLRPPAAPEAAPAAGLREGGAVEVEHLTLTPAGFEPAEVARPQGPFALVVEHRAGVEEVELSLEPEGGARLNALRSRRRGISWAEELDLAPGRYVLSAVGRPEWRCDITITAR